MVAAPILAEVASEAISDRDLSARRLKRYDRLFDDELGRELKHGAFIRRAFVRMDDRDLDRAGAFSARPDVRRILDTMEIDDPSAVIPMMLRHPSTGIRGIATFLRCVL